MNEVRAVYNRKQATGSLCLAQKKMIFLTLPKLLCASSRLIARYCGLFCWRNEGKVGGLEKEISFSIRHCRRNI